MEKKVITEQAFDQILIDSGFVINSIEKMDELIQSCPAIIRVRYEHYGPEYFKVFIVSVSLRSWHVYVPISKD